MQSSPSGTFQTETSPDFSSTSRLSPLMRGNNTSGPQITDQTSLVIGSHVDFSIYDVENDASLTHKNLESITDFGVKSPQSNQIIMQNRSTQKPTMALRHGLISQKK